MSWRSMILNKQHTVLVRTGATQSHYGLPKVAKRLSRRSRANAADAGGSTDDNRSPAPDASKAKATPAKPTPPPSTMPYAPSTSSPISHSNSANDSLASTSDLASASDLLESAQKPMVDAVVAADAVADTVAAATAEAIAEASSEAVEAVASAKAVADTLAAATAEAIAEATSPPPPPPASKHASSYSTSKSTSSPDASATSDRLKVKLLAAVASLDRGIAANVQEAREVDEIASQLEQLGGAVRLSWTTDEGSPDVSPMEMLNGTWRLVYSSGFNSGSLGGRRPGPPAALVPTILGQIYQRVDNSKARLDNIVEFLFTYPLPQLPWLPQQQAESPALRLTLRHDFEVTNASTVRIVYEDTYAQLLGAEWLRNLPKLELPSVPEPFRPPREWRSASFDVTYLDSEMRVTRGDRGELRVYLKDVDLEFVAPQDYVD